MLVRPPAGPAITSDDVSRFPAAPPVRLRRDGGEKAATTLNWTRSVIRTFFTWCERSIRIARNPAFFVRWSPTCAPPVRYMTRGEVRRLLSIIRRSDHPLAPRDYALFSALAYTGVRLSEITGVVWADLDGRHCLLRLRCAKGGRGDLLLVGRALGHRDVRSTQRYAHVEDRLLVSAVNRL